MKSVALALSLLLFFAPVSASASLAARQTDSRLNLNTATIAELTQLPGIGPALAARIIEHRRKHGPFKRTADVIAVRGMSARRYRRIAPLIRI
ncbi:MAG: helix-hairpin-helix domain-containing protein [Acidobacteria bacterium]|nr:helix-hairpin-helix domain-containing protein [Acidobacteriota bacterium]